MKILHILDHSIPLHSGYTFRTRAILEQQRALGWETCHVTSPKHNQAASTEDAVEEVDGFRFYRTPEPMGWAINLPIVNQMLIISALEKRIDEVVRELKPDIIHAHSPALNGEAAVRVGQRHNIPVVYEIRAFWEDAAVDHGTAKEWGLRYRLTRALETRVIQRADAVTTICEGLKKDIVARGISEQKVTVIPNAVNPERFQLGGEPDADLVESLGLQNHQVLGFIGSFYAYEGLSLLLEAVPEILKTNPDIRVLLVGGGPQEENLNALAQKLGIQDKVIFTGRVPHDKVQAYYDLIDILVYPRLSMRLTDLVTPLKPLEAMAQGRLFIASDVGGHKELIQNGVTGKLFSAGNVHGLAQSAVDMLAHKEQWPAYKAAGRHYVETERNWAASVSGYQPMYQALLEKSLAHA